jgi:hypothetical protein
MVLLPSLVAQARAPQRADAAGERRPLAESAWIMEVVVTPWLRKVQSVRSQEEARDAGDVDGGASHEVDVRQVRGSVAVKGDGGEVDADDLGDVQRATARLRAEEGTRVVRRRTSRTRVSGVGWWRREVGWPRIGRSPR